VSVLETVKRRRARREKRVRGGLMSRRQKPRVSVSRSLSNISAQVIDDVAHNTLASCYSVNLKKTKKRGIEMAREVGIELAKKAVDVGVSEVYFDRGSFLYHGRVKALADGLREGGLKF
jgi:large subunit ribosomal protein L18